MVSVNTNMIITLTRLVSKALYVMSPACRISTKVFPHFPDTAAGKTDVKQCLLSSTPQKYHRQEHKFKISWSRCSPRCSFYPYPSDIFQDRQAGREEMQWGVGKWETKSQPILLGASTDIVYSFSNSASTRTDDEFSGENSTSVFTLSSSLHLMII